ncbi:membrane protein [Glaciibacter superstes]|uniref:membrane protein n=1 Tax=Glaciibacter superstes TaxID=501023 RepID=UPI0003B70B01|nr:membrane protein [Glaciibacter superstes]
MTTPTGAPTRRRFWFDPRFAIGLALVVASVVGVGAVVQGMDRSVTVYAAHDALTVGDRVDADDLAITQVRLEGAPDLYVTPGRIPQDGLVVTRRIAAGELVPVSAVGSRAGASVTSVVIEVNGTLSGAIGPGSSVDVWSAKATEHGQFGPPAVLVGKASVVRLVEPTGLIAASGGESVEVQVPRSKVAAVLEAIANNDSMAIVPVDTPLGKE